MFNLGEGTFETDHLLSIIRQEGEGMLFIILYSFSFAKMIGLCKIFNQQ